MRLFSNVWSENTALFERLMEIHSNSPKLYYGFKFTTQAIGNLICLRDYTWELLHVAMTFSIKQR